MRCLLDLQGAIILSQIQAKTSQLVVISRKDQMNNYKAVLTHLQLHLMPYNNNLVTNRILAKPERKSSQKEDLLLRMNSKWITCLSKMRNRKTYKNCLGKNVLWTFWVTNFLYAKLNQRAARNLTSLLMKLKTRIYKNRFKAK